MGIPSKLFMSGRSQALRIPAKLHMDATDVLIERVGDTLWVRPRTPPTDDMGAWLEKFYAETEPLPDSFLADREDESPQARDWEL